MIDDEEWKEFIEWVLGRTEDRAGRKVKDEYAETFEKTIASLRAYAKDTLPRIPREQRQDVEQALLWGIQLGELDGPVLRYQAASQRGGLPRITQERIEQLEKQAILDGIPPRNRATYIHERLSQRPPPKGVTAWPPTKKTIRKHRNNNN